MKTIEDYTCYCTAEQTLKAKLLGAPISIEPYTTRDGMSFTQEALDNHSDKYYAKLKVDDEYCSWWFYLNIPTTYTMIGWLLDKGISIYIYPFNERENGVDGVYFQLELRVCKDKEWTDYSSFVRGTYQEAELAAIDAALDYLKGE